MSIDVVVKQRGFIKKELPLNVILSDKLKYGGFDGLRLLPDELDEDEFIAYTPEHIGRGFSVEWKQGEKEKVTLRILTPTSAEELKEFFKCIKRITQFWKCTIEVDGVITNSLDFLNTYDSMVAFNLQVLNNTMEEIINDEKSELTLFCAMWPLVIGKKEASRIMNSENLNLFRDYMHNMQNMDVYYAKPNFFQKDNLIYGRYVLTEDTRSVFPIKPYVPFGAIDIRTNKEIKVQNWELHLYSITHNSMIGNMSYESFINSLPEKKRSYYDAFNILIENLTIDEMEQMINNG